MLDTIEALAEVVRDEKRTKIERDVAIAALRDLETNSETFHDRSTASAVLKSVDGIPESESQISDHLLRLLYLADTTDTPENNERAREMYREHKSKMSSDEQHS